MPQGECDKDTMGLTRTIEPVATPISLTEAKAHLRIDWTADDTEVTNKMNEAIDYVERDSHCQLCTATYVLTLDSFNRTDTDVVSGIWGATEQKRYRYSNEICLPKPPLQSVTSIQYVDESGTTQTFDSSNYVVDTSSKPGRICLLPGCNWPATRVQPGAVTITFVAGWTTIPPVVKAAVKLMLGQLWENREATISGTVINQIPLGYEALLAKFAIKHF